MRQLKHNTLPCPIPYYAATATTLLNVHHVAVTAIYLEVCFIHTTCTATAVYKCLSALLSPLQLCFLTAAKH
eukprot:14353-Heterococcus_DN1.PRE.2